MSRLTADAQCLLWDALGEALPRARFMRDVPIGPYVGGFVSLAARLIVEVDGGSRGGSRGGARDAARARFLNGQGYRLIRFWDEDVLADVGAVLDALACTLAPELLADSGALCRIGPAAARAEWSPKPDFPARRAGGPREDKTTIAGVR
jgi:very-short-patch-repair endonuclease